MSEKEKSNFTFERGRDEKERESKLIPVIKSKKKRLYSFTEIVMEFPVKKLVRVTRRNLF